MHLVNLLEVNTKSIPHGVDADAKDCRTEKFISTNAKHGPIRRVVGSVAASPDTPNS